MIDDQKSVKLQKQFDALFSWLCDSLIYEAKKELPLKFKEAPILYHSARAYYDNTFVCSGSGTFSIVHGIYFLQVLAARLLVKWYE